MHGRILPRRACNSSGYTMKMSFRYHRLLIYDVKRTTKIDGIGPFKVQKHHPALQPTSQKPAAECKYSANFVDLWKKNMCDSS